MWEPSLSLCLSRLPCGVSSHLIRSSISFLSTLTPPNMLTLISILLSKQTHSDRAYFTSDPFFSCTHRNLHFTVSFKLSLMTFLVNQFRPLLRIISIFSPFSPSFLSRSSLRVPSMSHGVLAKLVTKLLDEKSQFSCSLGLLLQELITEAGNILLDFLQLTFNRHTQTDGER